jgi:hypothetical protein
MANTEATQELVRARLLGWGLEFAPVFPGMDVSRDLVLGATPNGRDFKLVRSFANLSQDLEVALTTLLGSDPFNTAFGFDGLNALAFETNPLLQRERLRMGVIRTVSDDPRVSRIVDVKLDDGRLEAGIPGARDRPDSDERRKQRAARTLTVEVAFETIVGERAVVKLEGVPA